METKNFTKKEALLYKKYQLENEIDEMNGRKPRHNLEEDVTTWRFKKDAQDERVADLQHEIEVYEIAVARKKEENEKAAKIEAYYSTQEGAERKAKLEADRAVLAGEYEAYKGAAEVLFKDWIKHFLGNHWTVKCMHPGYVQFCIWDADKGAFVFGSDIEVSYEKYDYWKKGEKFETNVGSMGSFDIFDTRTETRARYYIDLGKFLDGDDKLSELKLMCFAYTDKIEEIRGKIKAVRDELENPLAL